MARENSVIVLRRRSLLAFSWVAIIGLGVGMLAAVCHVTSLHGFRVGWQGIPVYFALAGILGRIANPKIILRQCELLVVNPLQTYVVPKSDIRRVAPDDNGNLEIETNAECKISAFAFSGSVIDHFIGTADEASRKIARWSVDSAVGMSHSAIQKRWTRCPLADLALLMCAATFGSGAIWMAVSGG